MTVQDIQEIGFEKVMFGGYDMQAVDSFLERVTEEFAAMQKENAALKAKMKVLVDKIEEYRGSQNFVQKALIDAQSAAHRTLEEAKAEAARLKENARRESEAKVASFRGEIAAEEKKLEAARKSTAEFITRVGLIYQSQAKVLLELAKGEQLNLHPDEPSSSTDSIKTEPPHPQTAEVTSVDSQVQKNVSRMFAENNVPRMPQHVESAPEDSTRRLNAPQEKKDFDFGELRFGADYNPKEES